MKTEEDEAFDELARKQGSWGGGFKAKQAMAADKLQEPVAFDAFLESQDFYELMQTYRHCQIDAHIPFEAVKDALRAVHTETALTQPAQEPVAWCPDVCPITGLPFFMWIEHHETGQMMPTYGGPYDSYTIPVRDKDGSYCRERYDHDNGWWVTDEVEDVGVQIVSDQAYVSEDEPPQRKPLTDKEINDLRLALDYDIEDLPDPWDFKQGFRAAERAYGIKEKNT